MALNLKEIGRREAIAGALTAVMAFGAAAPAIANDTQATPTGIVTANSIETNPAFLREASSDRLVLHYNPHVTDMDVEIELFEDERYKILAVADSNLPEGTVDAYISNKGPRKYTEDDVLKGKMGSELRRFYDTIYGAPNVALAQLEQ